MKDTSSNVRDFLSKKTSDFKFVGLCVYQAYHFSHPVKRKKRLEGNRAATPIKFSE
ncbi:MAG: hypothetical protein ACTHK0_08825 [Ginsengibacter sp.]